MMALALNYPREVDMSLKKKPNQTSYVKDKQYFKRLNHACKLFQYNVSNRPDVFDDTKYFVAYLLT